MKVTFSKGFEVATKDQRIDAIESELIKKPQTECLIRESFANGLYARQMTIPKGNRATGAIHKTHHFAVLNQGIMQILTDDGVRELHAGDTIQIYPGQKNCVYAVEDCVFTNFLANPNNETDTNKLVEMYTESKASELIGGSTNKQLAANRPAEIEA